MGNTPSAVPYGAQLNLIKVGLSCYSVSGNHPKSEIAFAISLTAPLVGGAGQEFYFSDIYPEITLPLAQNSSQYTADVSLNLDLSNTSPATALISGPASIHNGIQADGLQAGPFVLGQAGGPARSMLGTVNITLSNTETSSMSEYTCPPDVAYPAIIGGIVVDTSSGPALTPSNGARGGFPDTPFGDRAVVAMPCLDCMISGQPTSDPFNLSFAGVSPVILNSGQSFSIDHFTSFVTIPGAFVGALSGFYGGNQSSVGVGLGENAFGTYTGIGFGATLANVNVSIQDFARDWTPSDHNIQKPLSGSKKVSDGTRTPLTLPLPLDGYLTIDPVTAGASGSVFSVNVTTLAGSIAGYSITYNLFAGQTDFNCTLPAGLDLFPSYIV